MRIIAKLDVKPPFIVKPVHFEGLRKIGRPAEVAEAYFLGGIDEIMYIDIVASLYQREILFACIEETARNVFVPMGVGGGVKTLDDFSKLFHLGADKVLVNTYALQDNPEIIDQASRIFGAQSVVVNIEAKKKGGGWECFTDCGRVKSGRSVLDWVTEVQERGAGEILIQSVDKDGRQNGFDVDLVGNVVSLARVPIVAASGAGKKEDVLSVAMEAKPSGVAVSSLLHYGVCSIKDLKLYLRDNGVGVSR